MIEPKWLQHWIEDLLSDLTIMTSDFDQWMSCPERYSEEELMIMRIVYNNRKRGLIK